MKKRIFTKKRGGVFCLNTALYHFFLNHCKRVRKVYKYLCRRNPIVQAEINKQMVLLPFSHMLPYYQKVYKKYDTQLQKICKVIAKYKKEFLTVIDVGANIGDTVINIGIHDAYYLAIEGDSDYCILLERNLQNLKYNAKIENVILSDMNEDNSNYSMHKKQGTAMLVKNEVPSSAKSITLDCLMTQKYSEFHADIIKIDTDGFDFKVMRGGKKYIEKEQPFIFFEWSWREWEENEEDMLAVFSFLLSMGYEQLFLYDNFGNMMLPLKTRDIDILKGLLLYSKSADERIYYYDILAIPKKSEYMMTEFAQD